MSLATIREALADTLRTTVGGKINYYPRMIAGLALPAVVVEPVDGDYIIYHQNWRRAGVALVHFRLTLYADGRTQDAQRLLDDLLSWDDDQPLSIVQALMANPTLGGAVSSVAVKSCTGPSATDNGSDASILVDVEPARET